MKTKTLVLALTLIVLVVAASATYVLANPITGGSYYGMTGSNFENEAWWDEMRAHMKDRWADIESKDWWNEMRQYMEERWEDQNLSGYGRYGGYGGCAGMRW